MLRGVIIFIKKNNLLHFKFNKINLSSPTPKGQKKV